jgi:hypothetical protein
VDWSETRLYGRSYRVGRRAGSASRHPARDAKHRQSGHGSRLLTRWSRATGFLLVLLSSGADGAGSDRVLPQRTSRETADLPGQTRCKPTVTAVRLSPHPALSTTGDPCTEQRWPRSRTRGGDPTDGRSRRTASLPCRTGLGSLTTTGVPSTTPRRGTYAFLVPGLWLALPASVVYPLAVYSASVSP